jgi:hypothetical protein
VIDGLTVTRLRAMTVVVVVATFPPEILYYLLYIYTESFMNESVYCYGLLCVSVTFVDHVQTDHRRNLILCIGAHRYT